MKLPNLCHSCHQFEELTTQIERTIFDLTKNQRIFFDEFHHLSQKNSVELFKTMEILGQCKNQVDDLKKYFNESMTSYLNRCFEEENQ